MTTLSADDLIDLKRWTFSGLVVMALYGALATSLIAWRDLDELAPAEPSGAVVVDLAPFSAAPSTTPTDVAPGPEQTMAEAKPVAKPDTPQPDDTPELPQIPDAEAALNTPVKPQPEVTPEQQAAPVTSAPAAMSERVAPVAAAPVQGRPDQRNVEAIATWRSQVLALIERHKRYPEAAKPRREQGVAHVRFMLDRSGRVSEAQVAQSSGSSALDSEAIALLQRAQPFPAPPETFAGQMVVVKVPIRFTMK